MDSLSFTFLAYAAFCLARVVLAGRVVSRVNLAIVSGLFMMLLDVVIDPLAVRGDRWFLGHIFYYPEGGAYFGVPLTNFGGWWIVGALGVGGCLWIWSDGAGRWGRQAWPGVALYYGVLAFNLTMTAWIGEWMLVILGLALHVVLAVMCVRFMRAAAWPSSMLGEVGKRAITSGPSE
jgi:putative membrane protein